MWVVPLDGDNLSTTLGRISRVVRVILDRLPLLSGYRVCLSDVLFCDQSFILGGWPPVIASYNFQRRMSRLEQRWRAQRSVISIVNCRIPWTNRDLNVYCAFGISLKACLLQCLLIFMPPLSSKSFGYFVCAYLCVKALRAFDAFSVQVLLSTSNLNNTSCHLLLLVMMVHLLHISCLRFHSRHEVR